MKKKKKKKKKEYVQGIFCESCHHNSGRLIVKTSQRKIKEREREKIDFLKKMNDYL